MTSPTAFRWKVKICGRESGKDREIMPRAVLYMSNERRPADKDRRCFSYYLIVFYNSNLLYGRGGILCWPDLLRRQFHIVLYCFSGKF